MLKFHEFLKEVVFKKIPRKELMIKLHLEYDEFQGLDNITMSRWTNGVTKPSSCRQLLIANAAQCLDTYLTQCSAPKIPISIESQFRKFLNQFNSCYHAIIMPSNQENKVYHFKGDNHEAKKIYGEFTSRINFISSKLESFDENDKKYKVDVFYKGNLDRNAPESYLYFHKEVSIVLDSLNLCYKKCGIENINNALFFGLSFFKNSFDYELLFGLVLNYIIRHHFNVKSALFTARGREDISLYEILGAEQLTLLENSKEYGNVYLYHIDLQKVLSSPIFLGLIIKYNPIYVREYEKIHNNGSKVSMFFNDEYESIVA